MAIQVTCDSCFYTFQVKDEHAGKKGKCPECGEPVPIPGRGSKSSGSRSAAPARSASPRRSSSRQEESGSNQGTLIAAGIAGGIVVVGLAFFLFLRSGTPAPAAAPAQPVATNIAPAPPVSNPAVAPPVAPVAPVPNTATLTSPATTPLASTAAPPAASPSPSTPASTAATSPAAAASSGRKEYPSVADLIEAVKPAVCRINVKMSDGGSTGSGFVIDPSGIVVTNYHVIEGGESAEVVFPDNTTASVSGYLGLDPKRDLAVLKINPPAAGLKSVKLAEAEPRQGEVVVAIGAPLGFSFTSTKGDVSSMRKAPELPESERFEGTWVQTSTPISPGNSGGPLFNMYGEVVGANTMSIAAPGAQNLNFATSAENIRKVLDSKSANLIAMNPKAAPPREARTRSRNPNAVTDETKTTRGKELLRDVKEVLVLDLDISRQISNPRIQEYVTTQAERMWKKAGVEVVRRTNAQAHMIIFIRLKASGTSSSANVVEVEARIMVRDKEGRWNLVYDKTDDCGAMSQIALTKGDIPARTGKMIQEFFAKIPAAMAEADKNSEEKPDTGKKTESKKNASAK
ncbi:MAG: trypsin-like peptidase domain-containing protein [Planctomycetaceae bacterium]|nr:trypsin-like peptidase domain-containing protein [Planctomycetaceae bacterium]